MTWRILPAILVVSLLLVGCSPSEGPAGVFIENDLDASVRITYVIDGVEQSLTDESHGDEVAPGERKQFELDIHDGPNSTGCTHGDIVARTSDGVEVARIPPPRCFGDIQPLSAWSVPAPSG